MTLPPNGMAQRRTGGRNMAGTSTLLSRCIPSGGAYRPSAGAGVGRLLILALLFFLFTYLYLAKTFRFWNWVVALITLDSKVFAYLTCLRRNKSRYSGSTQIQLFLATFLLRLSSARLYSLNDSILNVFPNACLKTNRVSCGMSAIEGGISTSRTQSPTRMGLLSLSFRERLGAFRCCGVDLFRCI